MFAGAAVATAVFTTATRPQNDYPHLEVGKNGHCQREGAQVNREWVSVWVRKREVHKTVVRRRGEDIYSKKNAGASGD